ncbi:MAG: hypothetical protein JJT81_03445 [Rubellimicrobium sp.]|nr:hypothetical protein [Rubellimicrobium sp.]
MDLAALYGTSAPPAPERVLQAGPLSVAIIPGGIGAVHWHGVEVLRGAQALVRDADWGTHPEEGLTDEIAASAGGFTLTRGVSVAGGRIAGRIVLTARAEGLLMVEVELTPRERVMTNRAGLVVLHPADVAGAALTVRHGDGSEERTAFPTRISPGQPVFDIAELDWTVPGIELSITFAGEVFEMEDQRNWTDASFKTYCRPLSRPWPYPLDPDAPVRQSLTLRMAGSPAADGTGAAGAVIFGPQDGVMPDILFALEPGWGAAPGTTLPPAQGTRLRLDLSDPGAALPDLPPLPPGLLELELILPDDPDALDAAAASAAALGLTPDHIAALPAAWLKSYQPDGNWPDGATPEQALAAATRAFPGARPMGGVLTNFTELNRHPHAAILGETTTFGTSAIVHDASDLAVMQTLQALPAAFVSAAHLAGGRPLRLGLVAIAMRSNPYGAGLMPNPDGRRMTMTDSDPRHHAAFGAAFAAGALAATQGQPVASLCLAAPAGPFGLVRDGTPSPLARLVTALGAEAGRPRHTVTAPPGIAAITSDRRLILANLGPTPRRVTLEPGAVDLEPYAVVIRDRTAS